MQVSPTGEVIDRKTETGKLFVEKLSDSVSLEMVQIPEGKFIMGSPASEVGRSDFEGPQREVNVARFFMSKTPITQAQWDAVVKLPKVQIDLPSNPSKFNGPKRPVEQVNQSQAQEFCNRLLMATQRDYRLPSEAQWEYACRAGTTTPFYFGETLSAEVANYDDRSTYGSGVKGKYREQTIDVESFPANAWGLYDMHGNVWEWCADHWSNNYETSLNFASPSSSKGSNSDAPFLSKDPNSDRVLRGGSWFNYPAYCRSAYRIYRSPSISRDDLGFRLVYSLGISTLNQPS